MVRPSEGRSRRRGFARCGAWAVAVSIAWRIACEATAIEVGIGPLIVFFVVVLAAFVAIPPLGSVASLGGHSIGH